MMALNIERIVCGMIEGINKGAQHSLAMLEGMIKGMIERIFED